MSHSEPGSALPPEPASSEQTPAPGPAPTAPPAAPPAASPTASPAAGNLTEREHSVRQWAFLLHISGLAAFLLPLGGVLAPLLIWQLKRNEFPELDPHGKHAVNWGVSSTIYVIISLFLMMVFIGIPLLLGLLLMMVIFPVLAGVRANEGGLWDYPLTIRFMS